MTRVATTSTLPPQADFHHAVLRHLARHPDGDRRENIHEAMPDLLGLSEAQRTERLANLPHVRYRHRSGWALSMLKGAGYVDNPAPGIWRITARGRELLARYPDGFDSEIGRRVIREGRRGLKGKISLPVARLALSMTTRDSRRLMSESMAHLRRFMARLLRSCLKGSPKRRPRSSKGWCSIYCTPWATARARTILSRWAAPVTGASTA